MRQIVRHINDIIIQSLIAHACVLDAPVRDDDIAANPYSLAAKPEDLLPPSKLLEEHLFASDNNVFKKLLSEVGLV